MRQLGLWPDDAKVLGHLPQAQLKDLMSRSHALVLPSIEEGLALVQAQAMACGCPVIGTDHTGSEDLYTDGQEGFIVPIRRADLIAERLTQLADQPDLRARMSQAALLRVKQTGGWHAYGDSAMAIYQELLA
jgi:starch synthase